MVVNIFETVILLIIFILLKYALIDIVGIYFSKHEEKVNNKKFKKDVEKVWNAILVNGFYEELRNNHFLKLDNFKYISKISGISDWNRLDDIIRYINTEKFNGQIIPMIDKVLG